MKYIFVIVFSCIVYGMVCAQTGPGGISQTDGTGNLVLWLDASTIGQSNGSNVSSWTDLSGYSNTANAVGGNEPVFTTNVSNGLPAVSFTASNTDYLRIADAASLRPNSITVVVVGSFSNLSSTYSPLLIKTNNYGQWSQGYGIARDASTTSLLGFVTQWDQNVVSSALAYDTPTIMSLIYDQTTVSTFYDESSQGTDNFTANITNTTNFLYLGISPDGTTGIGTGVQNPMDGDISEVIIIDRGINTAERIILHNYLAAKYGFALGANDTYNEDNVGNGDYDFEVAGIGQAADGSNVTDAQGTGIVRILNPSGLGNNEFLIWGHDNGLARAEEFSDVPTGVDARFVRVWRVSERNADNSSNVNVGAVDMRWDLSNLGAITASDLCLLIDTDNDGFFSDETPIAGATSLGANIYEFASVPGGGAGIRNNRRFTIGTTNLSQTPLPIELLFFEAFTTSDGAVQINWSTASETNNEYFTIERSNDGSIWEVLNHVDGAGNSSWRLDYSILDLYPYDGSSYYRLKQTDFDGQFSYSKIENVDIKSMGGGRVHIYPNPTTDKVMIRANPAEFEALRVYNSVGMDVTYATEVKRTGKSNWNVDLRILEPGIYIIKTRTTTSKVYKN